MQYSILVVDDEKGTLSKDADWNMTAEKIVNNLERNSMNSLQYIAV